MQGLHRPHLVFAELDHPALFKVLVRLLEHDGLVTVCPGAGNTSDAVIGFEGVVLYSDTWWHLLAHVVGWPFETEALIESDGLAPSRQLLDLEPEG